MILTPELKELYRVTDDMLVALQEGIPTRGTAGSELRRVVGNFKAHRMDLIENYTIGTALYNCFEQARLAGASLDTFDNVRNVMISEHGYYAFGLIAKLVGMMFSFAEQCALISQINFISRIDVEVMMTRMSKVVEILKLEIVELVDGIDYQNFITLASLLMQHLTVTERKLPQVVFYNMPHAFPSLYLANYLYGNGARHDELIDENKVIHPAFFMRGIRALSA